MNRVQGTVVFVPGAARGAHDRGNTLGIPWVEAEEVAAAVPWLASGEARYVTGVTVPVDAGSLLT